MVFRQVKVAQNKKRKTITEKKNRKTFSDTFSQSLSFVSYPLSQIFILYTED